MPSLFEITQARLQQAHGGGSRRGPAGHTQAPTDQAQALHSAGMDSLHLSLASQQARAQQSTLQQKLLDNERVQKIALIQSVNALSDTLTPIISSSSVSDHKQHSAKATKKQAATVVPVFYGLAKVQPTSYFDFRVRLNSQIMKVQNNLKADRFMVETSSWVKDKMLIKSYQAVAILSVNEYGLVDFPAKSTVLCYDRYGGMQPGGWQDGVKKGKKFKENVGEGDHFLKPEVAAALFGILNDMNRLGAQIRLGDMSTNNGSDPGDIALHHSGRGHMGNRSGLDVDFRYLDSSGQSYQGNMNNRRFNKSFNQALYNSAFKYGFDKNKSFQGAVSNKSGFIKGVTKDGHGGHENHGHLGFNEIPSNVIEYEPYSE